jgi:hypothetical protein
MNVAEANPFLELRFTYGKKLACALEIDVSTEIVDLSELPLHGIADSANQDFIWNLDT